VAALAGTTVVVTRPAGEASMLSDLLRGEGAEVLEAPAIEILPASDTGPLDEAVADLCEGEFAWVVFSSPRAVDAVCERMAALEYRRGIAAMIAAVGPATAAALVEAGFHVHLVADPHTTEALASQFPAGRGRVLLPRADIAPPGMEEALESKGWTAVRVVAYRTGMSATLPDDVRIALAAGRVDAVAFTSASTVRGYAALTKDRRSPAVAIGPVTARAAREEGFRVAAVASPHTIEGVASAVAAALAVRRLFHITEATAAEAARASGSYADESLAAEGFIHCSFRHQVAGVANAVFAGRTGLVLLEIDRSLVAAPVRIEGPEPDGPRFPHVYGPIEWDAVVAVHGFVEGPNGFEAPAAG
jgi:uroporphyrinogen-III synthase